MVPLAILVFNFSWKITLDFYAESEFWFHFEISDKDAAASGYVTKYVVGALPFPKSLRVVISLRPSYHCRW